jgi:hypothetical protein
MGDDEAARARINARVRLLSEKLESLQTEVGEPDPKDVQIFGFLGGSIRSDRFNRPVINYMKGDEEREARRTLVKLLRGDDPLSPELRDLLAALFDPAPAKLADGTPIDRQLIFRRRGRNREFHRDLFISLLMSMQVTAGRSVASALGHLAREYRMTPEAVRKAWKKFKSRKPTP